MCTPNDIVITLMRPDNDLRCQPTWHFKLEGWPLVVTNCHDDTDSLPPPDLTLIEPQTCTSFQRPGQTELNNTSCLVLKIAWQPCSMMTCMLSSLFSFLPSNNLCLMFSIPHISLAKYRSSEHRRVRSKRFKLTFLITTNLLFSMKMNAQCLCTVAACEKAVLAIHDIVRFSPLTLHIPHWLNYNSILLGLLVLTPVLVEVTPAMPW